MKIGNKIKQMRLKNNLTQKELAQRTGLSKGFISQFERDLTSISISTLIIILECLGSDLKTFFNEDIEKKVHYKKSDGFVQYGDAKNKRGYDEIKWLIPGSKKNLMEPIVLVLGPKCCHKVQCPHRGEEFCYILEGKISLKLGNAKYNAQKGECFYFKAEKSREISNIGAEKAKILWVSSPPSFK